MGFKFQFILAFYYVVLVAGNHTSVSSRDYWKYMLPDTPLPSNIIMAKTLEDVLQTPSTEWLMYAELSFGNSGQHQYGREEIHTGRPGRQDNAGVANGGAFHTNVVRYFLEKDLHPGKRMNLQFPQSKNGAKFLPCQVADLIPFSSNKLPEILNKLLVDPSSDAAWVMKETIQDCERTAMKSEEKLCATSLESMIDFSKSKLGKDAEAIWTNGEKGDEMKEYSIVGAKRMPIGNGMIACHKMGYPYGVFYCHKIIKTVPYMVSLVAADGSKVDAAAACHQDTSDWTPKHLAFEVLKVKPGGPPVCHFLHKDDIVWLVNNN